MEMGNQGVFASSVCKLIGSYDQTQANYKSKFPIKYYLIKK
jgi:hypothetical protein